MISSCIHRRQSGYIALPKREPRANQHEDPVWAWDRGLPRCLGTCGRCQIFRGQGPCIPCSTAAKRVYGQFSPRTLRGLQQPLPPCPLPGLNFGGPNITETSLVRLYHTQFEGLQLFGYRLVRPQEGNQKKVAGHMAIWHMGDKAPKRCPYLVPKETKQDIALCSSGTCGLGQRKTCFELEPWRGFT